MLCTECGNTGGIEHVEAICCSLCGKELTAEEMRGEDDDTETA